MQRYKPFRGVSEGVEVELVDPFETVDAAYKQGQIDDLTLPRGAQYDQDTYTGLAA